MRAFVFTVMGVWLFIGCIEVLSWGGFIEVDGALLFLLELLRDVTLRPFELLAAWLASWELPFAISDLEKRTAYIVSFGLGAMGSSSMYIFRTIGIRSVGSFVQIATSATSFLIIGVLTIVLPFELNNPEGVPVLAMISLLWVLVFVPLMGVLMNLSFRISARGDMDPALASDVRKGGFLRFFFGWFGGQFAIALATAVGFYFVGDIELI